MVLFHAIGPVKDVIAPRNGEQRTGRKTTTTDRIQHDELTISADAREAAKAVAPTRLANNDDANLRLELIAKARENISKGLYKQTNIINDVAACITHHI